MRSTTGRVTESSQVVIMSEVVLAVDIGFDGDLSGLSGNE